MVKARREREREKPIRRTATRIVSLRAIRMRSSVRASSFPTLCITSSGITTMAAVAAITTTRTTYKMKMMVM